MKRILLMILLAAAVLPLGAEEVLLRDFAFEHKLFMRPGNEVPGGKYECRVENGAALVECDLSEGGAYCQLYFPEELNLSSLRFTAETDSVILVRLTDSEGETFQLTVAPQGGDKREYALSVKEFEEKGFSFPEDRNGRIDLPAKLLIGPEKKGGAAGASMKLYRVWADVSDPEALKKETEKNRLASIGLQLKGAAAVNIYYTGEKPALSLVPFGFSEGSCRYAVTDHRGRQLGEAVTCSLSKDPVPIKAESRPGLYYVNYTLTAAGLTKEGFCTYAVLDRPAGIDKDRSYFGVNGHFNQGWPLSQAEVISRLGISWLRDGEATLEDKAHLAAEEYGIRYMPCFTGAMCEASLAYAEKEIKAGKAPDSEWDFAPYIRNYGEYADKFGYMTRLYDIVNEPHNFGWSQRLGGGWNGGPWFEVYWQWAKQVSKVIKEHQKDARVVWEDLDGLNWAEMYLERGITNEPDYLSPHAYNLKRDTPLPEDQDTLLGYAALKKKMKEKGARWKLNIGEVGFSSFQAGPETSHWYAPCDPDTQADWIVRMCVLHLNEGVDRIFYYDLHNDGTSPYNQEHNFGLVYENLDPKPAGVAYANLINVCDNCKWTGRRTEFAPNYVFGFVTRFGKKGLVCWNKDSEDTIELAADRPVKIIGIMGDETRMVPAGGKITLRVSPRPQFVIL